jgi:choline dehydrogenase-like flavoprotein
VVLAAGALHTPAILLRSALGRGIDEAFLGRYLMRHCNGVVVAVFPFATNPDRCFHKQLCLSEFYEDQRRESGTAVGIIQDMYTPAAEVLRHFAPLGIGRAAGLLAGHYQNLMCIAEDEPQARNRVFLANERDEHGLELTAVEHGYTRADLRRRNYLVTRARRLLRRAGGWPVHTYRIGTFSHALGTVRCGDSPATGALDPDCRYWGIDNLYVTDSSFMPTAGGVNPSLTIAANALRVADRIAATSGGPT